MPEGPTQLGQVMQDLSKGTLPIVLVCSMLAVAASAAYWAGGRTSNFEQSNSLLARQVSQLETQVQAIAVQMNQIAIALAKPPVLPENVAFKADLYKFCLVNRELTCPNL